MLIGTLFSTLSTTLGEVINNETNTPQMETQIGGGGV